MGFTTPCFIREDTEYLREKLKKQEDCSCYLPRNVVQYIQLHHLYQMGQESTSCD